MPKEPAKTSGRPAQRARQGAKAPEVVSAPTGPEPTPQRGSEEPVKREHPRRRPDPAGEEWHGRARGRWEAAVSAVAAGKASHELDVYEPPALPKWTAAKGVKRELYGRYLADRATGLVHDVQHATEGCAIDAITGGTFYHFESELPDELVDHLCMEAD